MDKSFERKYSLEIPKLRLGENEDAFSVDRSFFAEFEHSFIEEGDVEIEVLTVKYNTHLDMAMHFKGVVTLHCDRCLEPYPHEIDFNQKVIYSYSEELEFDTDEVILIKEHEPILVLVKEFFDFINLQVPIRRVPSPEVHVCDDNVLRMLGLLPPEEGEEEAIDEEEEIDPRWAALKNLSQKDNT